MLINKSFMSLFPAIISQKRQIISMKKPKVMIRKAIITSFKVNFVILLFLINIFDAKLFLSFSNSIDLMILMFFNACQRYKPFWCKILSLEIWKQKFSNYLINRNKQQMLKFSLKNLIKVLYFAEEKKLTFLLCISLQQYWVIFWGIILKYPKIVCPPIYAMVGKDWFQ